VIFSDTLDLATKPQFTADGYMVATAKVARTGIQLYSGDEMGKPDMKVVRVYRPESEVFSDATVHSFAYRPMTNDHPAKPVTADNWKELAIGQTGGEVMRDKEFIRVPLVMMDGKAIKDYQDGKQELSMGYTADIKWEAGETPDGEHYDAIQTNIRNNHIALVGAARAGHEAKIGAAGGQDGQHDDTGGLQMADMKKITFNDVTIEVSEQAAEVIASLKNQLSEATANAEAAQAEADKALAEKDAKIEKLESDAMTADKLDAAVKERSDLIGKAKSIADANYSGKSSAEIKRTAVAAVLGDEAVKDKSEAYIDARFDVMLEDADKQKDSNDQTKTTVTDAQAEYEKNLTEAWKEA